MKNIFFTNESVKRQITDSISENLTDSDLESVDTFYLLVYYVGKYSSGFSKFGTLQLFYSFEESTHIGR